MTSLGQPRIHRDQVACADLQLPPRVNDDNGDCAQLPLVPHEGVRPSAPGFHLPLFPLPEEHHIPRREDEANIKVRQIRTLGILLQHLLIVSLLSLLDLPV